MSDHNETIEAGIAALGQKLEKIVRFHCDEAYDTILNSVQDYLIDNAQFNIGSRISRLECENQSLRDEIYELAQLKEVGQFLLDRISELEWADDEAGSMRLVNDWFGHVEPALCRFRDALSTPQGQDQA